MKIYLTGIKRNNQLQLNSIKAHKTENKAQEHNKKTIHKLRYYNIYDNGSNRKETVFYKVLEVL